MKLDMLSTYTQSSMNTIDQNQMFTNAVNNNQFVYMQSNSNSNSSTNSTSQATCQSDIHSHSSYMQQRYNTSSDLDSYYSAFNASSIQHENLHLSCRAKKNL